MITELHILYTIRIHINLYHLHTLLVLVVLRALSSRSSLFAWPNQSDLKPFFCIPVSFTLPGDLHKQVSHSINRQKSLTQPFQFNLLVNRPDGSSNWHDARQYHQQNYNDDDDMLWFVCGWQVKLWSHCYTWAISECSEVLYKFICLLTYHSNKMINSGFESQLNLRNFQLGISWCYY